MPEPSDDVVADDVNEPGEPVDDVLTPDGEGVHLTNEQYDALLDRVEELEASTAPPSPRQIDPLDDLAEEGVRSQAPLALQQGLPDLENMTRQELANYIQGRQEPYLKQLQTDLQEVKVLREIDKCEDEFDDFWDYEKEVYQLAKVNPGLSVRNCYKLAKGELAKDNLKSDDANDTKKTKQRTRTEKLIDLPPRHLGEKPLSTAGGTKLGGNMNLNDAAAAAFAELNKSGRISNL